MFQVIFNYPCGHCLRLYLQNVKVDIGLSSLTENPNQYSCKLAKVFIARSKKNISQHPSQWQNDKKSTFPSVFACHRHPFSIWHTITVAQERFNIRYHQFSFFRGNYWRFHHYTRQCRKLPSWLDTSLQS